MKPNKLAIIVALKSELTKDFFNSFDWKKVDGFEYVYKKTNTNEILLILSGVGKVNAARAIQFAYNAYDIKNFVNVGSAGSRKENIKFGHICFISKAKYLDVDATTFGYKIGQVPNEPQYFRTNNHNMKIAINGIHYDNFKVHKKAVLGTADSFINDNNARNFNISDDIDCIDMEGTSIIQVANKLNDVKIQVIKVISDNISSKEEKWTEGVKQINKITTQIISNYISNGN